MRMTKVLMAFALAAFVVAGCRAQKPKSSEDLKAAYEKITVGMTEQEVMEAMRGFPGTVGDYYQIAKDGTETRVHITFKDGKVVDKEIKTVKPGPPPGARRPSGPPPR